MKSEDIVTMVQRNIDQEVKNTAVTEETGSRWRLRPTVRYQTWALRTCRLVLGAGGLAPLAPDS